MNIRELKTLLKENKIHFYTYWDKKKLIALANEHDLLPKIEPEKEKRKNVNYDRLKTIKQNPRKVMLDQAPKTYWNGEVWKNKYKVVIE